VSARLDPATKAADILYARHYGTTEKSAASARRRSSGRYGFIRSEVESTFRRTKNKQVSPQELARRVERKQYRRGEAKFEKQHPEQAGRVLVWRWRIDEYDEVVEECRIIIDHDVHLDAATSEPDALRIAEKQTEGPNDGRALVIEVSLYRQRAGTYYTEKKAPKNDPRNVIRHRYTIKANWEIIVTLCIET